VPENGEKGSSGKSGPADTENPFADGGAARYGIVLHIQRASDELLSVEEGSLYPALHRIEQSGWIRSEWKLTDTNRKAKYYRMTAAGQKEFRKAEESFEQLVKGVRAVLRYAQG